jgi:hypothetical protein
MINSNNDVIKIFESVSDAIKEFPGCASVLNGRCKQSHGYNFEYIN